MIYTLFSSLHCSNSFVLITAWCVVIVTTRPPTCLMTTAGLTLIVLGTDNIMLHYAAPATNSGKGLRTLKTRPMPFQHYRCLNPG